jgi:hypothetical protein
MGWTTQKKQKKGSGVHGMNRGSYLESFNNTPLSFLQLDELVREGVCFGGRRQHIQPRLLHLSMLSFV